MSSDTLPRTKVLRGQDAARIRGVAMDTDLSLLRPILPPSAQTVQAAEEASRALREEASRVGYEDGYAAGRTRAMEDAAAEISAVSAGVASALAALESATASLSLRQGEAVADVERQVTMLAVQIAETILGHELSACDAPAREAITRALRLAPPRTDAVARLHPDDLATIAELDDLAPDRAVTLVADPAVESGGCVLEVGPCRIDAQVGPALARVRKELGA